MGGVSLWFQLVVRFVILFGLGLVCHRPAETLGKRRLLLFEQIIDLLFRPGQIVFDGSPHNAEIHVKVIVDHPIAHAPHVDSMVIQGGPSRIPGLVSEFGWRPRQ